MSATADTDPEQLSRYRAAFANLDAAGLLDALSSVAAELEELEAHRTSLYQRRLAIFQVARAMDPPVTQRELASHAQVTEPAVIQALRKAAKAEANGG